MKLVIIEAPGKIQKIKEAITLLPDSDEYEVVATNGQIYDLPKEEIAIDYSDFSEKKILRNIKTSRMLIEKASNADIIYLMTDNDNVGEQISRDVLYLINDVYNKGFFRVRISSMNSREILKAINESEKNVLDQSMIDSSDARRIVNRTIGYGLFERKTGTEKASPFGSIATPVISEMMKPDTTCGVLKSVVVINEINLPLKTKIPVSRKIFGNEKIIIKKIDSILKDYMSSSFDYYSTQDNHNVLNCYDALNFFSKHLKKNISSVERDLQSSYEKGQISYFRTSSRENINDIEQQRMMEKYFALEKQELNEDDLDELDVLVQSRKNKDAHAGIQPVTMDININDDSDYMDDADSICQLIAKYNYFKIRKFETRVARFTVNINEKDALELRRMGVMIQDSSIIYEVNLKKPEKSFFEKVYDEDICFYDVIDKVTYKRKNPVGNTFHINNTENVALDIMERHGIGKPSTYGYHSSSIGKYFDSNMMPNGLAKAGYMIAKNNSPELIDIKNIKQIEDILDDKEIPFDQKIEKSLNVIGLNLETMYNKFKPDNKDQDKYKKRKTEFEFN